MGTDSRTGYETRVRLTLLVATLPFLAVSFARAERPAPLPRSDAGVYSLELEALPTVRSTEAPRPRAVYVDGGSFRMGNNHGNDDERPVREVSVEPFFMLESEVTAAHYLPFLNDVAVTRDGTYCGHRLIETGDRDCPIDYVFSFVFSGSDPARTVGRPMIEVSWYGAVAYANWLSEQDGLTAAYEIGREAVVWNRDADGWRLPTEAEWEFASRGGRLARDTVYAGSNDPDTVAWYDENADQRTHEPAQKLWNELGLYDMSGNVREWCWDRYSPAYYQYTAGENPIGPPGGKTRVVRGGSWRDDESHATVWRRDHLPPHDTNDNTGFRLVREAPKTQR